MKNHIPLEIQEEHIEFYLKNYDKVERVYCSKCEVLLALEVSGVPGLQKIDRRGVAVLPIGDSLLSSRVRLDETSDGEPMMGYQCVCGNDTRLSRAEAHHPPANGWHVDLMPHDEHQVKVDIGLCGKHKADFSSSKGVKQYESFRVEAAR